MPYVILMLLLCAGGVVAFVASSRRERLRREERVEEARWRRIVEALPQLVWTAAADGSADYFSPQSSTFTGLAPGALLDWGWLDAIHPDERASAKEAWTRAVADGCEYQAEHRFRRFDGEYRWFSCRGTPVRDDAAKIVQWAGVSIDVTDRKVVEERAQKAKRQLELMMRLSQSSLLEYALTDGDISRSRLVPGEHLWMQRNERAGLADREFPATLAEMGVLPEHRERVTRAFQQCVYGETPDFEIEVPVRAHDGTTRWRLVRGTATRDAMGKPVGVTGVGMDITELKRAAELGRAIKERLERAILGSKAHTWHHELVDGTMVGATSTYTNMWESFGYDPNDADFASSNAALLHPEDAPAFATAVDAFLAGREREWEREVRVRHKDGSERWHLARGVVERDPVSGKALRYTGCSVDITDLKRMEQKLRESEEQFRATFENAAVGMAVSVAPGRFVACNQKICDILGYAKDEIIGHNFTEFGVEGDLPDELVRHRAFIRGDIPSFSRDKQYVRKDGTLLWANMSASVLRRDGAGVPTHVLAIVQDISVRKSLEQDLQKAKALLELGIRGSEVSIFDFEIPDGAFHRSTVTWMNLWELLGYEHSEAPRSDDEAAPFVMLEERLHVRRAIAAHLLGDDPRFELEHRLRHKDGSIKWFLARGTTIRNAAGVPVRFIGSLVDITEKKRVEERLRASEQRWRSLTQALPQLIWTAAADGTIEYLSDQACAFTGLSEEELLGDGWANAIHPDELAETGRSWLDSVERQTPHEVQHRLRRWDGAYRWFTTRAEPARDAEGRVFKWVGSSTEITMLKELEGELRRAKDLLDLGIRGSNVAIFEFDMPDGRMETARQTMINVWETLGYDPASAPTEFVPGAILAIHPDDIARVQGEIQEYLSRGSGDFEAEYRVRHRNGSVLWRLARGIAFWSSDGTPTRFIGSFFDITDKKRVEEQLRESEQRWRNLAETLPQFVFTTGPDGMVDYFSARAIEYTGAPLRDLLGLSWANVLHPDDRAYSANAWMAAIEQQHAYEVEHRIRRRDGAYRWFSTRAEGVRDADGRIYKWLGTCTDITSFKELESALRHAKERLEVAIRSSNLGIWEYDIPDGVIEHARQTFTNVWESLGYDATNAPRVMGAVIHPEDRRRVEEEIRACLSGETAAFETEHRVRHNDGMYRWVLGRGVALREPGGRAVRFVGTSVDITEIKTIEEDLQRAREAAETANRAKDEFLANVSHEIRTPMNAILGMTELALDSSRTDHQRQLLSTVKSAAKNLLGIINDLLDFSKIAAGKLALDEADFWLRAEVGETLRALSARAHRKGIELICHVHPDVPDALFGDAGRVRQVLMNLVGNALKFTAQGEVVVEVTNAPGPSSDDVVSLVFTVRDTGIGIARDKQAAIFRAFEQADSSTTRQYGGTGLGLTISAQLAALMNGTISVESELGHGSTFAFTACFARSSRSEQPGTASPELLEGLNVLVVDDNETNRGILREWLTNWRMRPTVVGDATSAFEQLSRGEDVGAPYSLVLLDERMPDVDGITLARQILQRYGISKRLILLSSDDSPILATRSREVGIRAYLLKPTQQSDLLETIWVVMNASTGETPDGVEGKMGPNDRAAAPRAPALRILVAEDNELNAALLKTLLRKRGHRAQFAEDGRLASKRAAESSFDLVLLDLHMPEMDGFEVVRTIRDRELTTGKHLPIIALTARSSIRDRDRCLAAGMDDFLPKPIEADALWATIDRVMAAFPPATVRGARLLDARAVLRACAGDSDVFDGLCEVFGRALPEHLARVRSALTDHDLPRLAEASHKLSGTLAAFSTVAGAVALTAEDAAKRGDFESCVELVGQLDAMGAELLEDTRGLTMDDLSL